VNDHWLRKSKGRARRRGWGIHAYVGLNGSGKSLAMVWDTLPSLDEGRPVLSTVRLLDFRNPRPCDDENCTDWDHATHLAAHPAWVPFTSWEQVMDGRDCDVLMDEMTGVASSRASAALPADIERILQQLRHRDVRLRWTAPAWARAEIIVRECTQVVTQCQGFLAVSEERSERVWRDRRLFRWRTYDRAEFGEFTDGRRQNLRPLVKEWYWGPGSDAFAAYDTLAEVLTVGAVGESGRCLVCGGRRNVPMCRCEDRGARGPRQPRRPVPLLAAPASLPELAAVDA